MKIERVVFWQNILSIHQSAFVRALAAREGIDVWLALEEDLPDSRKAMGWTIPNYGAAKVVDARHPAVWSRLVTLDDVVTCHAFGSYFRLPQAYAAFRRLRESPCQRIWTTEAFNFHGLLGWVRLQRTRWHVWREACFGFNLVLAMGQLGVNFFRRAGIRLHQLREFGYLVEPPVTQVQDVTGHFNRSGVRLLFVGQMIRRKGVDQLLRASCHLAENGWSLDLIGDGAERQALMSFANRRGLSDRVRFLGNLPNSATLSAIQSADFLVLPSRWDGWGAVVNEALMLGTPAIVSDGCGAASIIVSDACGRVFRRGDEEDLRRALQSVLERGTTTEQRRKQLKDWAIEACGAAPLTTYFLNCLEAPRQGVTQCPPWRTGQPG